MNALLMEKDEECTNKTINEGSKSTDTASFY